MKDKILNEGPFDCVIFLKQYFHKVEIIKDASILSNQMVSLDMVSFFTKVPMEETLSIVRDRFAFDSSLEERTSIPIDNLMEMLTFCTQITHFGMGSHISTGWGLSNWLAIITSNSKYIQGEYFEEMALESISLKPTIWLRYVDDTFKLWPYQEDVQILWTMWTQ